MTKDSASLNRFPDAPRDRPRVERFDHANFERPGAQAHPRASALRKAAKPAAGLER